MKDETLLGQWVRRFLLEHLVAERNLARNTQVSYRDTLALLLMGWTAPRTASSVPRWSSLKAPSGREAVREQVYHRYLGCHARRA